ncbi:hypothetical protein AQUCO_01500321v1 [Aquilegia coerulea]|uniref:DUF3456 domain-containing protein n=1 Tax=Aquilegia coerulea TaxID=218851 RepID=A0A2G5DT65_AQUCA|nr:hypothetical protein AQUCO_01500321v1 [Aquilegia coerulea]
MEERWTRMVSLVLLIMILVTTRINRVSCIDDKCAACNAVAEELEIGLSNEKPRNHLDLRNRLDSKGQRQGKVIDYRVSELRVVELLDGLCEKMQEYTLDKVRPGANGLELMTGTTLA